MHEKGEQSKDNSIKENYDFMKDSLRMKSDYSVLDRYFSLGEIDDNVRVLKKIRSKITDQLEDYSKLLEDLMSPDSNLKDIIESKELDESERNTVFKTYKKLRYFIRWSNICELKNTDEADAEFIDECMRSFPEIHNEILLVVEKLKLCWSKDIPTSERIEYFG